MPLPIFAKMLSTLCNQIASIGVSIGPAALPVFILGIAFFMFSIVISFMGPMFGFDSNVHFPTGFLHSVAIQII